MPRGSVPTHRGGMPFNTSYARSTHRPIRSRELWITSLVVCGLFIAEDPGMIAVRVWLSEASFDPWVTDLVLACSMVGYNYAASRYVVGVAAARHLTEAMERVDTARAERVIHTRNPVVRAGRHAAARLNPFNLVKWAGGLLGRGADEAGRASARSPVRQGRGVARGPRCGERHGRPRRRPRPRDIRATVVPGAITASLPAVRRIVVRGANLVAAVVGGMHDVPGLGVAASEVTGAIGFAFTTLTDPTRPPGACTIAAVLVSVVRYAVDVERELGRSTSPTPGPATTWPPPPATGETTAPTALTSARLRGRVRRVPPEGLSALDVVRPAPSDPGRNVAGTQKGPAGAGPLTCGRGGT